MRPLVNPPRRSRKVGFLCMFITLITFLLGILVDSLQSHVGVNGWALWVDEAAAAIAVGFIVFAYERRREKALLEKLKVIELMNHHVRNALQPVMYLPYSRDKEQQFNMIEDAVNRIEWALREILPGRGDEEVSSSNAA